MDNRFLKDQNYLEALQFDRIIVASKLMGYKVIFAKTIHGHPMIVIRKQDVDFFKLRVIGDNFSSIQLQLSLTTYALRDKEIFNKYKSNQISGYRVPRFDPSCVSKKSKDTFDSCNEIMEDLLFLL